jgi:hypothetical protein
MFTIYRSGMFEKRELSQYTVYMRASTPCMPFSDRGASTIIIYGMRICGIFSNKYNVYADQHRHCILGNDFHSKNEKLSLNTYRYLVYECRLHS